jgi:two-component system chemotaxis response regulator CheY
MTHSPDDKKIIDFLVVDDQEVMLQAIRNCLRELYRDKQIVIARNGKEALQILKEHETNFLITDWNMPEMTGIELLQLARSNPDLHALPVMMISDELDREKFLFAMEEGVDGYQIKPFTQGKLMTSVGSIVKAREAWGPFQENMSRLRRLFLLKKYDTVISLANKISQDQDNPDIMLIKAESYFKNKDYGNARNVIKDLVLDEQNGKAMHLFGRILMIDGNSKQALPYLKKSLALNPINYERKIDVGRAYLELGMHGEAAELLGSIRTDSHTDLAMLGVAKAYMEKGDVEQAGVFIDKISDPIPETIAIFNEYALQLSKIGEFAKSSIYYRKCLKMHPDNEAFLFNIAVIYYKMGDNEKARGHLEKLLNKYPNNKRAPALLERIIDK